MQLVLVERVSLVVQRDESLPHILERNLLTVEVSRAAYQRVLILTWVVARTIVPTNP